jgi:hypothetical protein
VLLASFGDDNDNAVAVTWFVFVSSSVVVVVVLPWLGELATAALLLLSFDDGLATIQGSSIAIDPSLMLLLIFFSVRCKLEDRLRRGDPINYLVRVLYLYIYMNVQ